MGEKEKDCPCATVVNLKEMVEKQQEVIDKQNQKIVDCQISFASINAKLNIVISALSAIGVAIIGVIVKMVF